VNIIFKYFWPMPPREISEESKIALKKDLKEISFLGIDLKDKYRRKVGVSAKSQDREARQLNSEWLAVSSITLAKRWAALCISLWAIAFLNSGNLFVEVPFTLLGICAGTVAIAFWCLRTK